MSYERAQAGACTELSPRILAWFEMGNSISRRCIFMVHHGIRSKKRNMYMYYNIHLIQYLILRISYKIEGSFED